jgi:hypothetical protein
VAKSFSAFSIHSAVRGFIQDFALVHHFMEEIIVEREPGPDLLGRADQKLHRYARSGLSKYLGGLSDGFAQKAG